jgi:hypothetical protein
MGNPAREYLRKLKEIQRKNGDEKLTQEEIDMLFKSLKDKEGKSLFPLSDKDKERDEKLGIKRKPWIGCLISSVGSIVVWSLIYYIWVSL